MTNIEQIYFSLLRVELRTGSGEMSFQEVSDVQWEAIYNLSIRQGTCALLWNAIQELQLGKQIPTALRVQWAYNTEQIENCYRKQVGVLMNIATFYASHDIPLMLLKGYGLSLCYPRSEHRPCGDIDIWLYGKQCEADALLRREWNIPIDEDVHHHTVFVVDGIMVENHYDFLNIHAHASNRDIEHLLRGYAGIPGETVDLNGAKIHLPTARFNALFLLRHAAAHFAAAEIGVRHVVDWAMFVRRYHDAIDWQELYAIARQMNMHRFLNCLNAISIDSLGLCSALFPDFERDVDLEQRVLNDILHPEFSKKPPKKGFVRIIWFKTHRWLRHRWKHKIVYREGMVQTFFDQVRSHLLKPKSITH